MEILPPAGLTLKEDTHETPKPRKGRLKKSEKKAPDFRQQR
jgi:hypothetical protein